MDNKKVIGFTENMNLFIFIGAVGAIFIGLTLLRDDVMSTAYTMLDYFPKQFGVTPVIDLNGGIIVGLFFSFTQIAGLSAALTKEFDNKKRITGLVLFLVFMFLDSWTDVVYRSNYLTGDIVISMMVTGLLYTLGSEFSSGISYAIMSHYWRPALSEFLMVFATVKNKLSVLGKEWSSFDRAAKRRENNYVEKISTHYDGFSNANLSGQSQNMQPSFSAKKEDNKNNNINPRNNEFYSGNRSGNNRMPVPPPNPNRHSLKGDDYDRA